MPPATMPMSSQSVPVESPVSVGEAAGDEPRHRPLQVLTAHQIIELWWAGGTARAAQRRLRKLFDAGYLERFRPISRRGSFPWTYHLGHEGHRMLQHHGLTPAGQRYAQRRNYDYGHVLHEIQLNAWILAYRRALGPALISWDGETDLEPPPEARDGQLRLGDGWSVEGLREPHARLPRPDAVLEIERGDGDGTHTFLIEYDRSRRVDEHYGKSRRYDAFLGCPRFRRNTRAERPR